MSGGGKGKKQTVGYKHFVGMHLIACHGPVDALLRLTVDDRPAWTGRETGGQISINAPELFGGEGREGGVSGTVDVEMGLPDQTKNDYLLSKIGSAISAYRGVVGLVFRQCYLGNNPYLKPWRMRMQRIHVREDGAEQWYDEKAEIAGLGNASTTSMPVVLTWQQSSFHVGNNDHARMGVRYFNAAGTEIGSDFADMIGTPRLVWTLRTLNGTQPAGTAFIRVFMEMQRIEGTNNDGYIDDIKLTVGGSPVSIFNPGAEGGTAGWTAAVGGIDTKNESPAPFLGANYFRGGQVANTSVYQEIAVGQLDINPAHIIRECLTNPDWGMGYSEDDVDDAFFVTAADGLFAERLGMSLLWDRQSTLESFISEIIRHIDGALYVSRETGKFRLKLTRLDYDPDDLILLDESNIDKIEAPRRPAFGELANSVTVNFWNYQTSRDDSVTVQDPAGIQMQGAVINTTLQYPGFTKTEVAARVAARDLRALSNPFLSCTIYTGDVAADLDIGDTFKLSWAKWGLVEVVMRVSGFAVSDGKSNQIRINCVEDEFDTPLSAVVVPPPVGWVDPAGPPEAVAADTAFEVPYYEMVQQMGQVDADAELAAVPERGFVGAAAMRGGSAGISARLWTDGGDGYEQVDTMDLCPGGFLDAAIIQTDTALTLVDHEDLDLIEIGSHGQIGDGPTLELVRVDSVDAETGEITVGRGVLDTVPRLHPAGTAVLFWDNFNGFDETEYVDGETIDAKITPISGQGQVALGDVTANEVTLDQRAYRPYPPGNLLIEGGSYVQDTVQTGALTVAWVGRDRLLQTSGELADHFDGNIGPEAGVTYRVETFIDGVSNDVQDPVTSPATVNPTLDGLARIEVSSKRDGVYSWQAATHEFPYIGSGSIFAVEDGADTDYRLTEAGDYRGTEN